MLTKSLFSWMAMFAMLSQNAMATAKSCNSEIKSLLASIVSLRTSSRVVSRDMVVGELSAASWVVRIASKQGDLEYLVEFDDNDKTCRILKIVESTDEKPNF